MADETKRPGSEPAADEADQGHPVESSAPSTDAASDRAETEQAPSDRAARAGDETTSAGSEVAGDADAPRAEDDQPSDGQMMTTVTSGVEREEFVAESHAAPPPGRRVEISPEMPEDAHDHGHGLAHTTPVSLLFAVFGALLVLTVLTVAVTQVDLGGEWNLVVAMIIATVKAGLVVVFFMHLLWDRKFNLLVFLSSVLFLILFLSLSLNDRSEYQPAIDRLQEAGSGAAQ